MRDARRNPKVSVIIPTLGESRRDKLNKLLSEIEEQTFRDYEILVIKGDDRQGRAINTAAAKAKGEIFIILDDDTGLGHPALFKNLIRTLESDSSIGMAGASTIPRPNDSLFQKIAMRQVPRRFYPVVERPTESDMVHHPCCAIPRRVFEEIGGENEVLIRGLDPELRFRIRSNGYKIVIAPDSWIYHPLPESAWGIFRMYFKNGKGAAFAYRTDPDSVYEVAPISQKRPLPAKTALSYRIARFAKRILRSALTLRIITLLAMTAYGLGYIAGFISYRNQRKNAKRERVLYNKRYSVMTAKEIFVVFIKEVLINRNGLFRRYLKERLVLYDAGKIRAKYGRRTLLWMHGHTIGEMNTVLRLSKILKNSFPEIAIIASTAEPETYKLAGRDPAGIDEIIFLPFDVPYLIRRAFGKLMPKLFVSIKVMLWPNLFFGLKKLGVKTMVFDGCTRSLELDTPRYGISKELLKIFLNEAVDFMGMFSAESAGELAKMGVDKEKIKVSKRFRLDFPRDFPKEEEKERLLRELNLSKKNTVIIAGSTWDGEEEIFLKAFKGVVKTRPGLIAIIAPRQMRRVPEVCGLVLKYGFVPRRKTTLGAKEAETGEVIILDTFGELHELYGIAELSIVGGSFKELIGSGNITKPILKGSPVITGPYTYYWDGVLEEMNVAKVHDWRELKCAIEYFLDNPDKALASRDFALNIIDRHRGAFLGCREIIGKSILAEKKCISNQKA